MSRILLPLAIAGSVLAQVPTADWKDLSALSFMGMTLVLLVWKVIPGKDAQHADVLKAKDVQQTDVAKVKDAQVLTMMETFSETIKAGFTKDQAIAEKSAAVMTDALDKLAVQHQQALDVGKELATAIADARQTLARCKFLQESTVAP